MRTDEFTVAPIIDDVWCRRHGLFEWANLLAVFPYGVPGGGLMPRGAWPELQAELERIPCLRCDRKKPDCVCHPRSES